MKSFSFYSSLTILISLFLLSCDSTNSVESGLTERPSILSISTVPSNIDFTLAQDGYRDTTITVQLSSEINLANSQSLPGFNVRNLSTDEVINSGLMASLNGTIYSASFDIETSTTAFSNFVVQVFVFDDNGNINTAEKYIEFRGFSNARPVILEVNNPAEVNRPATGQFLTQFTAKVTDADGQQTIDRVLVRILDDSDVEVPDSPFQMFDDGVTYNDIAVNDSVYSITFPIASSENQDTQNFSIEYFAIDQGGIYSDTTRTNFTITNNQ